MTIASSRTCSKHCVSVIEAPLAVAAKAPLAHCIDAATEAVDVDVVAESTPERKTEFCSVAVELVPSTSELC